MERIKWYENYEGLMDEVIALKGKYESILKSLNGNAEKVLNEIRMNLIAMAVHESNWQEGIFLEEAKTKEITEEIFEHVSMDGPHLAMKSILKDHRKVIDALKKQKASIEEIATYNLSTAHFSLGWIAVDCSTRIMAGLIKLMDIFEKDYSKTKNGMDEEARKRIEKAFAILKKYRDSKDKPTYPLSENLELGAMIQQLMGLDYEKLVYPMHVTYLHFLHKLTLMGILPEQKLGNFRKGPVHVGNPNILFPPASLLPKMIDNFCKDFPSRASIASFDLILASARASYQFVRIHPYADGNGRISRLIMNLVLWNTFPPVYLKADKQGRHKYLQALKRADRGNIKPLACLIALSLISTYQKMIDSIKPQI